MKAPYVFVVAAVLAMGLVIPPGARASDTDDRIEAAAKQTYVFRTQLKDDSIQVQSKDGVVTLTGAVSEAAHKSLAEDTVKGLPGVQSVDNRLEVKPQAAAENSDGLIVAKVKMALLFHRSVSALTEVDARNGIVTLHGTANSQAEKDLTTQYVRDVEGVKRVDNQMAVATTPAPTMSEQIDDASITAQVKFTLLQHRSTSAVRTQVETTSGVVTLQGKAKNQAEIDLVTKLVKDITGVKDVKNQMTVQS
jgi:hyperosmotically inducible protein